MGHFCQLSQLVCFDRHHASYLHFYTDKGLGYLVTPVFPPGES